MSAGTSHPEEAWRWLDFLSHQPEARPFGAPFLPTRRSVAEEMGFWEDLDEEMAAAYRFALEHSLSWIGAYEVGGALHEALPAILKGEKSVEEALADAQIAARQALVEQEKEHEEATPQPVVVATPKPETGEGVAITFVPFFADTATYRELAEAFHDTHPEISVEVRELSFAGRFGMKDLASSSDCFAWFGEAGDEEALQEALNLEPFLEAERDLPLDDFYPQVLEPFRWRGDLWGLPAESSMKVIYYNKDLLNAAGVEYPRPGWDLDDFLTAAKALTRGEGDDKQYGFLPVHGHGGEVDTFITLRGASLVNDQAHPPRPRFDDPDVVEAVHWHVELATVHGVMPIFPGEDPSRPETSAWEKRQSLIREGKAAMWSDTVGSGTFFPEDLRRGIAPLPLGEGKMADLFVWGYYISKDTPYPRQCWEWIKFLSDHGLEATRGLPARRSAAESPQFRTKVGEEEAEVYLFSLERTEEVRSLYESPWLGRSHYWLLEALGHVMEGKDPEWALAEAQRKAEAYIMCLESKDGFADEEVQKACAKEVDPNYREFGEEE
jgi:ABC-type glycerol-3-phosphate transport system substrate-binding protein